jgi:heparan-alpha-glucosaminide N-acetyltransferase
MFFGKILIMNSLHKNVVSNERYSFFNMKRAIFKRTVLLIAFGLIVNSIGQSDLNLIRFSGVLQRCAISYAFVSLIHLLTLNNRLNYRQPANSFYGYFFADIHPYLLEWAMITGCIGLYTYFTLFYNYDPDCPTGYQGPGGLHDHGRYANCTGGAARAIDVMVFGKNHMYTECTAAKLYQTTLNHDPEGVLGTFTAILITFYGLQVSKILLNFSTTTDRICRLGLWSAATGFIGFTSYITDVFPISKNLFSFSFVNLTGSVCFATFLCIYFVVDCKKYYSSGWPFRKVGCNSIALYLGHELLANVLPFYYLVDASSHFWLLIRATSATCLWIVIADWLAANKIHIVI